MLAGLNSTCQVSQGGRASLQQQGSNELRVHAASLEPRCVFAVFFNPYCCACPYIHATLLPMLAYVRSNKLLFSHNEGRKGDAKVDSNHDVYAYLLPVFAKLCLQT
jgi:hypothetical protein